MKTYSAKASEINKDWIVVDARDAVVGRLASFIANRLRGKHKPTFTRHMDCGDNVIVINAEKVQFTGNKWADKSYFHHTGYAGGIKEKKAWQVRDGRFPERVLHKAIERMIPRGPLGRQQMSNLRIYAGEAHPHEAQQPESVDFKALNVKNSVR